MQTVRRHVKRVAVEGLGWLLVAAGLAALVLPGPGLLLLFAGLALLATHYQWAEKRVDPIRKAALKTAADSVKSGLRIFLSSLCCIVLIALGTIWGLHPAEPAWWPLGGKLWLPGGWGTGGTIIGSGVVAAGMIIYSYFAFRPGNKHKHK